MSELQAGPLQGVRVLDFTMFLSGPYGTRLLADMGAEVIKIEPVPSGDNTRRLTGSGAGFFAMFNRNKRSLALDLKSPRGKEIVLRLEVQAPCVVWCRDIVDGARVHRIAHVDDRETL